VFWSVGDGCGLASVSVREWYVFSVLILLECARVWWCVVECCGVLWSVVEYCGVLWSVVECCGVLWSCRVLWSVESCRVL